MPSKTWVDFKAVKAVVSMGMVLLRYGLLAKLTRKAAFMTDFPDRRIV